jgi:hypothetical protein
MAGSRIIEKFQYISIIVNPAGFGYRTVHVLVRTNNAITKDDVIARVKQFGDITHYVHHMGRTFFLNSQILIKVSGSYAKKWNHHFILMFIMITIIVYHNFNTSNYNI